MLPTIKQALMLIAFFVASLALLLSLMLYLSIALNVMAVVISGFVILSIPSIVLTLAHIVSDPLDQQANLLPESSHDQEVDDGGVMFIASVITLPVYAIMEVLLNRLRLVSRATFTLTNPTRGGG